MGGKLIYHRRDDPSLFLFRGSCSYLVQALMFRFALVNLLRNSFVWRVSGRRGLKFNISSIWFFIKRKIQVTGWIDRWWKQPLLLLLQLDSWGFGKMAFCFSFYLDTVNDPILDTSRSSLYLSPSLPSSLPSARAIAMPSPSSPPPLARPPPPQPQCTSRPPSSPFFAIVTRLGLSSSPRNSSGKTALKLKPCTSYKAISTALLNFAGCAVAGDT